MSIHQLCSSLEKYEYSYGFIVTQTEIFPRTNRFWHMFTKVDLLNKYIIQFIKNKSEQRHR